MIGKRSLEKLFRGWFPQEPAIGISKSANLNVKLNLSIAPCTLSFALAGALMIIAAILSAFFVFINLRLYWGSLLSGRFVSTDYRALFLGLFDSATFGASLFAAMLLLLGKKAHLAKLVVTVVAAFGSATPLIYIFFPIPEEPIAFAIFNSIRWLMGLSFGFPIIAFSIPALVLLRSNRRRLQSGNMQGIPLPFAISGSLMIIASLMPIFTAIETLSNYGVNAINGSTSILTYQSLAMVLLGLGAFGTALPAGWLLLKRRLVGLSVILAGFVLVFASAMVVIGYSLYNVFPWAAIALTTTAFALTALILVGLNFRKFKQGTNTNTAVGNSALPRVRHKNDWHQEL